MATVENIRDHKDVCTEFFCEDCNGNNWSMFIYSLPKRIVLECISCGAEIDMEID